MRHVLILTSLLALCACSDFAVKPLVKSEAFDRPDQSAMQQMINQQLASQATEPPPAPVPGREAARMGVLQPLPNTATSTNAINSTSAGIR